NAWVWSTATAYPSKTAPKDSSASDHHASHNADSRPRTSFSEATTGKMKAPKYSVTMRKLRSGPPKGAICTPSAALYPNRQITLTGNLSAINTLNHMFTLLSGLLVEAGN